MSNEVTRSEAESRETSRVERLHRATSRLHACSSREAAYEVVIEAAVEELGFDWCCLAEADGETFELVAVSEAAPASVGDRQLATDEGLAGEAYQSGESVLSEDARADESAAPVDDAIRSGLSVPIEGWGVFQCAADEPGAFDDADVEVVELLLSHAAEAFRRIDKERELRRQNERLDRFVSVVSHDLRNPLDVATGRLDLYRETGEERHLEAATSALDRMETLVEDLLSFARDGRAAQQTAPVRIRKAAEAAWGNVASRGTLSVDCDRVVEADWSRVVQLFENLFRNSAEHAEERDAVTITVGDTEDGFYVADDGPGIPEENREDVFDVDYSTSESGTGFGLAIVEAIAEAHGWSVSAGESESGGARFDVDVT